MVYHIRYDTKPKYWIKIKKNVCRDMSNRLKNKLVIIRTLVQVLLKNNEFDKIYLEIMINQSRTTGDQI